MLRRLGIASILLALAALPLRADEIELKNGRRVEGKVVARTASSVRIQVASGVIELPRSQVVGITERATADELYAEKAAAIRYDDPAALDELASWAEANRLVEKAGHLRELAKGVRLEERFARARRTGTASAWVEVADWAKREGHTFEVRRLALTEATRLAPRSLSVRSALEELARDEESAREIERARAAKKPVRPPADAVAVREKELEERERLIEEREKLEREREKLERERLERERSQPGNGYLILRRGRGNGPGPMAPIPGAPCPVTQPQPQIPGGPCPSTPTNDMRWTMPAKR